MALTDREVGDLIDFMGRSLERLKARGMPEQDNEVRWWLAKAKAEMALRLGQPVIDPGPKPPIVSGT
jgi:hypothetical protein